MKYNLTTIRPKGFLHSSAFAEVKDSLAWALSALGHQTMSTENAFSASPDSTNVIFGAELFSPDSMIPPNSVVYNLEQPAHPRMETLHRLIKAAGVPVWDYNVHNLVAWHANGVHAEHLPVGYTPNLTRIPRAPVQDIDVLFYGWMTPRRSKLIQDLRAAGLNVIATDSCYGGGRDQLISCSKIVLNVNHDGRELFNIVRVSFLLANSKCVISEIPSDVSDYAQSLNGALYWHLYEDLVKACCLCAKEENVRVYSEIRALGAISKQDFIASVENLLLGGDHARSITGGSAIPGGAPSPDAPLALGERATSAIAIHDRYERGCRGGDMKDFLPVLRSLAKGQLLEIGVRDGASTSAFLLGLEERGGHLTSVDIQDCSGLWTHPQWRILCQDSKACVFPDSSFDLALIDGDHSPEGFRADLENCLRWVRPGGLVLCHDISPLPNFTNEARGGDWPSEYVGEEFFKAVRERELRHFIYPGVWGLGCIIKDPA